MTLLQAALLVAFRSRMRLRMCAVVNPSCSKESRVCTYLTTLCILTAAVASTSAHSYFGGPENAASLADGRNQEDFFLFFGGVLVEKEPRELLQY
jgi:hypothetical protein